MRLLAATLLFVASILSPATVLAQADNYPSKPVKIVVGYAAGGATDIIARLMAQRLTETMGAQFIVENRPGANSNIGAEVVAKSPPDGYTLYMGSIANTINMSLYKGLSYDTVRDFAPVAQVSAMPNVLVVHPSVPANNLKELIALAKAQPGTLNFASSGSGSSIHLSGELFKMLTGVKVTHVPYKGSAPAVTDLLGGQVQMMFDNAPSAMPHIKSGKLRPLAVLAPRRIASIPDVPTAAEAGLPGFEVQSWFGLLAPAATPREVIAKLNTHLNQALAHPETRKRMAEQGSDPVGGTPEQLAAHIRSEIERWSKVVKDSGARVD